MSESTPEKHLGSVNDVPWRFSGILQRLIASPATDQRESIEQDGLTAVFIGITAIETFTNIYCRIVAEEPQFAQSRRLIIQILQNHTPTDKKLTTLATKVFRRPIDETDPRWEAFRQLRKTRNHFVHFKSSHETVRIDAYTSITGLVDTSAFAALTSDTPKLALATLRGIVEMTGTARGIADSDIRGFVHSWLGLIDV